jgi:hypothetical protein
MLQIFQLHIIILFIIVSTIEFGRLKVEILGESKIQSSLPAQPVDWPLPKQVLLLPAPPNSIIKFTHTQLCTLYKDKKGSGLYHNDFQN